MPPTSLMEDWKHLTQASRDQIAKLDCMWLVSCEKWKHTWTYAVHSLESHLLDYSINLAGGDP